MVRSRTIVDSVNPFASTAPDMRDLYHRIDAVHARGPVEPERYWEDHLIHGSGRRTRLRSRAVSSSRSATDITKPITLPPRPSSRGMSNGELAVVAVSVAAGAALVWWLWKKRD